MKVEVKVRYMYGDGATETIKVPADLIERDRLYRRQPGAVIWAAGGSGHIYGPHRTARAAGPGGFIIVDS